MSTVKMKPRRRQRLTDLEKWRIEMLAKGGWFAHRFIASVAFDLPMGRVGKGTKRRVTHHLLKQGIKVSEGRLGQTPIARDRAIELIRPPKGKAKRRIA